MIWFLLWSTQLSKSIPFPRIAGRHFHRHNSHTGVLSKANMKEGVKSWVRGLGSPLVGTTAGKALTNYFFTMQSLNYWAKLHLWDCLVKLVKVVQTMLWRNDQRSDSHKDIVIKYYYVNINIVSFHQDAKCKTVKYCITKLLLNANSWWVEAYGVWVCWAWFIKFLVMMFLVIMLPQQLCFFLIN